MIGEKKEGRREGEEGRIMVRGLEGGKGRQGKKKWDGYGRREIIIKGSITDNEKQHLIK